MLSCRQTWFHPIQTNPHDCRNGKRPADSASSDFRFRGSAFLVRRPAKPCMRNGSSLDFESRRGTPCGCPLRSKPRQEGRHPCRPLGRASFRRPVFFRRIVTLETGAEDEDAPLRNDLGRRCRAGDHNGRPYAYLRDSTLVHKVFLNSRHPPIQRLQTFLYLVKKETHHCYSDNCEYAHTFPSWNHYPNQPTRMESGKPIVPLHLPAIVDQTSLEQSLVQVRNMIPVRI